MFKIAAKDLKLFFADKRGMLLTFAVPIALITLFAFAFGGAGGSDEPDPLRLVIADQDKGEISKQIIDRLDSLEEFVVIRATADSAENLVIKGKKPAALFIPDGTEDSIHAGHMPAFELKYDQGQGPEVGILEGALIANLNAIAGEILMKEMSSKMPSDSMVQFMPKQSNATNGVTIRETPLLKEKESPVGLIHAVAGTAIMMLLFSVTGMGSAMLEEKQEGTLKKLMMAPINPSAILFGKMISVNVISILQLIIMFIYGWLMFGLDLPGHIFSTMIMIVCTAFACSAFGVFLVSIAKSKAQVQGLSTLIILTMSAIGGSMIPSFIMPAFMQKLSVFSVNYWGIQGFYDVYWRELAITDPAFLTRVAVLLAIGTGLNLIATRLFRRNIISLT
jgi:ABC-type multidrug transport system permease subunit